MASPVRGALAVVLAWFALSSLEGCTPSEIVVVTDSDAIAGQDFVTVQFRVLRGPNEVNQAFADASALPATWGLTPGSGSVADFDVSVTLSRSPPFSGQAIPFAVRKALRVHFVEGELKQLFLPVPKSCGGNGTNFPNPVPPECRDLTSPALGDFDEDSIPHLPKSP